MTLTMRMVPSRLQLTHGRTFSCPLVLPASWSFEQRAYLDTAAGSRPEWLYIRLHEFCGIATEPWKLLKQNLDGFKKFCGKLQCPDSEIHYRGHGAGNQSKWAEHTLNSRGYLLLLLFLLSSRPLKNACKQKVLQLFLGMLDLAFRAAVAEGTIQVMVNIVSQNADLVSMPLTFDAQGLCKDAWGDLLSHSPGACSMWSTLRKSLWLGRCITTELCQASLCDIIFFVAWVISHPGSRKVLGQKLYVDIGLQAVPLLFSACGQWLDRLARIKSAELLRTLPILKTKQGSLRKKIDPVNRMLLLFKLRKDKLHRQQIARTHGETVSPDTVWARRESLLDCVLHQRELLQAMQGHPKQVALSWDPSNYGGKEVMVIMGYSSRLQQGFYCLNQLMAKMRLSDVRDSLIKSARQKQLDRVEGYNEIRALGRGLESINMHWSDFKIPPGFHLRALQGHELRILDPETGRAFIYDESKDQLVPEVPLDFDLGDLPVLISISDQGPINWAALNYMMWSKQAHLLLCLWDPYHRAWNDCKNSAKKTKCRMWRAVLELVLLFNLSYGPFGSSQFHYAKRALLEDFLSSQSFSDAAWQRYQPLICSERRQPEPMRPEDSQALFESLAGLENFVNKGPLIKLMRWFSVFEGCMAWQGDFWATKLILSSKAEVASGAGGALEPEDSSNLESAGDDKSQLNLLKKRKGTWALAPNLIDDSLLSRKDILMSCGRALWKMHAARARNLKTPGDVAKHYINAAANRMWAQELVETVANSLWRLETLQHLLPQWCQHTEALDWHLEFFTYLLEARAMSLTSFYCLPPFRYSHLLSDAWQTSADAHAMARADFQALLKAEAAQAAGAEVHPLRHMYWTLNPFLRALFLAHEQDNIRGQATLAQGAACRLHTLCAEHYGDSRLVENAHQHGKDLLRSSKHESFGVTRIFSNTLSSGALEDRVGRSVAASNSVKATSGASFIKVGSIQSFCFLQLNIFTLFPSLK